MMSFIDELIMIVVWHIDFLVGYKINVINSLQILEYFILFEVSSFRLSDSWIFKNYSWIFILLEAFGIYPVLEDYN